MRHSILFLLTASITLTQIGNVQADTITGWRADGTGHYPGAEPVLNWSASENVLWKTPLPNWGNCMPVLVGENGLRGIHLDHRVELRLEAVDLLGADP